VHARRSPPWLSLASAACAWATLVLLPGHSSPDSQALAYLAWSVPLAAALGTRLLAPAWWERATRPAAALAQRHLPALSAAPSA
jgi:hypothetical protein